MRRLPNGEKVQRTWLIYSTKSNSVLCFCCKLFALKQNKLTDIQGFSDWRHLATRLSRHEMSVEHTQICKKWYELKTRLDNNCTIDKEQQRYFESEKRRWRAIIERIIAIVQFLAGQCLAFRDKNNESYETNNGNF
jgi:hypothetical protein